MDRKIHVLNKMGSGYKLKEKEKLNNKNKIKPNLIKFECDLNIAIQNSIFR